MEPPETNPNVSDHRWSGLGVRVRSAIVLGLICFSCVWLGGVAYTSLILLAVLIMKREWDALVSDQSIPARILGYFYVILPCASLIWLRDLPVAGLPATVALVLVIAATDVGAYFVGRSFGRHKLSPVVSPNKTWEGLGGGIVAAVLAAVLTASFVPLPHSFRATFLSGVLISLLAQAGDLFESSLKRKAGVKDSGTILPGHGGLLDRFDGYMFAAPVYALLVHFAAMA